MEADDNRKLYELQDYDNTSPDFPEPFQEMQIPSYDKSPGGSGRIQFAIQIIQLILLVMLLIAAVVILYQVFANASSDCSPAPVVGSNNALTVLANTSIDTQSAVKEVSQIMLAEIERRLNDTATLKRLVETTDISSQQILDAIFDANSLANITSDAVDEKLSRLLTLTQNMMLKIGANFAEEKGYILNNTELLNRLINGTSASAAKLMNIVNTLGNIQDTCISAAGVVDDVLLIVEELLELHNETAALPTSCKQIKEQQPSSPSGYYILAGTSGTYSTYCNMDTLCGSGGGWTRVAYLDMSDATQSCPSGLRYYQSGGVRVCGRTNGGSGCSNSIIFSSNGVSYTQICGRITGYEYGHPDGIDGPNNLNANYVDGISITRGSPRQHVWTLMAGLYESSCPCVTGNSGGVRTFMGSNYFCESGNPGNSWSYTLYTSDPLWDGQGCRSNEAPCCNTPPWFHRDYGSSSTTDFLEMRICADGGYTIEDSPVSYIEMYIK